MPNPLFEALIYLLQIFVELLAFAFVLRFLLQLTQTNFYNPISQAIVKITNPFLKPLRNFLPSSKRIDSAAIIAAIALKTLWGVTIFLLISAAMPPFYLLIVWAMISIVKSILNIFLVALLIVIVTSWLAPHSHHPGIILVRELCYPLMHHAQRLIPPISGIDLSPILIFFAIQLCEILIIGPLSYYTAMPSRLFLW